MTPKYKYPCVITPTMVIDEQQVINAACHGGDYDGAWRLVSDNGRHLAPSDEVNGCTIVGQGLIYTQNTPQTMAHELRHLMDRHCRTATVRP